jgi:hypothetical protein
MIQEVSQVDKFNPSPQASSQIAVTAMVIGSCSLTQGSSAEFKICNSSMMKELQWMEVARTE